MNKKQEFIHNIKQFLRIKFLNKIIKLQVKKVVKTNIQNLNENNLKINLKITH